MQRNPNRLSFLYTPGHTEFRKSMHVVARCSNLANTDATDALFRTSTV